MALFEERRLLCAISEYMSHYHSERNYQGLGNAVIAALPKKKDGAGPPARRERLGGLLSFYYRETA